MFKTWISPGLLCCLLFRLVSGHTCPDSSMPETEASNTSDPRWRVLSGLDATAIYTLYSQYREMAEPPLINTTDYQGAGDGASADEDLDSVIDSVCKLVSLYELVSSTNSGSNLHTVLSANLEDSCNWLHHLISSRLHVSASAEFQAISASCSPDGTTRLHHYCLERQIRTETLRLLVHRTLLDSLHTYYAEHPVPATQPRDWLRSTSIPAEQQSRILDII